MKRKNLFNNYLEPEEDREYYTVNSLSYYYDKLAEMVKRYEFLHKEVERKSIKGDKGDKGERGEQGIQGIQGVKGEKGEQGIQGIQGIKGDKGERGEKGEKGEQGEQGIQGVKGEKGEQGEQGEKGEVGEGLVIVGELENEDLLPSEGNTGEAYLIEGNLYIWSGESWNNVGSIKGVKGDKGERGEKGEKGDTGEQGEQGLKGDTGEQGEQGIQGLKGEDGEKGEQGDIGLQGLQGEQGEKGEKGDKGDSGDEGLQGIQGEKGEKGDRGLQGIQGEKGEKGERGEKGEVGERGLQGIKGDTPSIDITVKNASYQNGWSSYDVSTHYSAQYFKDVSGLVYIRGSIKGGTGGVVFTLPVGYRPFKAVRGVVLGTWSEGFFARYEIFPNGQVTLIIPNVPPEGIPRLELNDIKPFLADA